MFYDIPVASLLPHMMRIVTVAVSDANKKHMLQFDPLVDTLLEFLMLDKSNRRYGQGGADSLQEASAGVLHELSLFGPGCAALRSHGGVVSALHRLCEVGTRASKMSGTAALFELEEERREAVVALVSAQQKGDGTSRRKPPPPHVMASYNWDHQDVILRVVTSLQERGYLVWVDTEQMKGATVDTMALAPRDGYVPCSNIIEILDLNYKL